MAVTSKPTAQETPAPYTVRRAFVWPTAEGGIAAPGTVLQLTKTQAQELLQASKVAPGEPEPAPTKAKGK